MPEIISWDSPAWQAEARVGVETALTAVERPPVGPIRTEKSWGRSCIQTVTTAAGPVWIKHGYRLPPGEEKVLPPLAGRWPDRVPRIVTTLPGTVIMEPLSGRVLEETDPVEDWVGAARALAEMAAGESTHAGEWLAVGVRDRRPDAWKPAVMSLLASPGLRALDGELRSQFEAWVPEFISRYETAFRFPATLVHQDSGCCNIHLTATGPVVFDWADVVVGHPVFSCDRLLDQVTPANRERVITAFCEPLGLTREEFGAMRRSNVLHEILRYHDELAYLAPDDPVHQSLADAVRSQIAVLMRYEIAGG